MNPPKTMFSTCLSGSARETELRIRNIVQWKKKSPPVMLFVLTAVLVLSCFGLISCGNNAEDSLAERPTAESIQPADEERPEPTPELPESVEKTEQENAAPAEDLGKQPYGFMVKNSVSAERRVYDEWSPLTEGQKDLLSDIPADKLPKESVNWGSTVTRGDIWEDTLVPLAYHKGNDVTLYGVVGAEKLWGRTTVMPQEVDSDGLVLRVGDRAAYYPFSWEGNHWYGGEPMLEILDTDGDGQADTAAVAPWAGRGVGVHVEVLYLIDLNDLTCRTVDFSQMKIQVWCDPEAKTATLSCGDSSVVVDTSGKEEVTHCTAIDQVHFRTEGGKILCSVGLDFGGAVCYWAWANGIIQISDEGPYFGDIVLSDKPTVQNG